jgi:hypothetical protein
MKAPNAFQTRRLTGRAPSDADTAIYASVFGNLGLRELQRNLQDNARYGVAPWTLQVGGKDVGVGGFRIGFGEDEGIEIALSLLPDLPDVGVAGEFLADALLFVMATLRADRVFAYADGETTISPRMLTDAGFHDAGAAPTPGRPERRIMRWTSTSHPTA